MKRYRAITLFFCFFIFYGGLRFSAAEEDLKTKIEARLLELKQKVLQEQMALRTINERLSEENDQLAQENNRLKQMLAKQEEKIVYKADPNRGSRVQEIEQDIALLNKLRRDRQDLLGKIQSQQEELQAKDKHISSLKERLSAASSRPEETQDNLKLKEQLQNLTNENNRLKLVLREAENNEAELTQRINSLEDKLKVSSKEKIIPQPSPEQEERIQELEQEMTELKNSLQEKTQQIAQKDQEISSLRESIDITYNQIKDILE